MIGDKVILGGLVGVLGKLAMDIFQIPLWLLKIVEHPLAHYAGSLLIVPNTIHHTLLGQTVSFIADYIYGIFWGMVFVYLIYRVGKRHLILKGLLFGAFLWFFSYGGLRSLPMVKLHDVGSEYTLYFLWFHLVYGLALGYFMKLFFERHWIE